MNSQPQPGTQTFDPIAKAHTAWTPAPEWVLVLAQACKNSSQTSVAAQLDYSASTISQVISNTYRGDVARVKEKVVGAFMGITVDCPILGDIGRDRCIKEQSEPFRATSAMRAQLFHACKTCLNARKNQGGGHAF